MTGWILVLAIFYSGYGNAVTSLPPFGSEALCKAAGEKVKAEVSGTFIGVRYSCVHIP